MHQNRFRLGLRPRPRWGSLRRSPRPLSRMGRGIPPPHTLNPSAPMAPRPSRLRRSSRRLRRLDPSLFTPSAFGCLTEAKAHPTSSFWRRHCGNTSPPTFLLNAYLVGVSVSFIPFHICKTFSENMLQTDLVLTSAVACALVRPQNQST